MTDERTMMDHRLDAALRAMREPPPLAPGIASQVAARAVLANAPAGRGSFRVMRVAALLAIAAIGGAGVMTTIRQLRQPVPLAAVTGATGDAAAAVMSPAMATAARPIVFELDAPTAQSVQVVGDFNQWSRNASTMHRSADGRWRITTMLPPGRYVYAYLVDGRRFRRDPVRDAVEDRDFGVPGSELVVGEAP
jgi:hypothetical protein